MQETTETNEPQDAPNQEASNEESSDPKKETFQWNTPADEFAEDVGSDIDEDSEDEGDKSQEGGGDSMEGTHCSEISNGRIDVKPRIDAPKRPKTKNQFPCPKCNKVWNWPWELRRHLVMHFKEV